MHSFMQLHLIYLLCMEAYLSISEIIGIVCELALFVLVFIHYYFCKCLFKIYKNNVCSFSLGNLYQEKFISLLKSPLLSFFCLFFLPVPSLSHPHIRHPGFFAFKYEQERYMPYASFSAACFFSPNSTPEHPFRESDVDPILSNSCTIFHSGCFMIFCHYKQGSNKQPFLYILSYSSLCF